MDVTNGSKHLFYSLPWVDPLDGRALAPRVLVEDPTGRPFIGALIAHDGRTGYPIVNGILHATPELARQQAAWLHSMGLEPPSTATEFQATDTVDSFGFEWTWDAQARTEDDLSWRVASRYGLERSFHAGKLILDAGAGAGDQSRWLLDGGARGVVSVELSRSIEVISQKLSSRRNWVGIRGDLLQIPLAADVFDFVYCEGVIQHTRDSRAAVHELCRVLRPGGHMSATHYGGGIGRRGAKAVLRRAVDRVLFHRRRERLSKWDRDTLFLYSGVVAWLAHRPMIGSFLRRLGYAIYDPRMLTFKATWCCTYDAFGNHSYSREIPPDEFRALFEAAPGGRMELLRGEENVLLLYKQPSNPS